MSHPFPGLCQEYSLYICLFYCKFVFGINFLSYNLYSLFRSKRALLQIGRILCIGPIFILTKTSPDVEPQSYMCVCVCGVGCGVEV